MSRLCFPSKWWNCTKCPFYCVPEHCSCHRISQQIRVIHATNLPCSLLQ